MYFPGTRGAGWILLQVDMSDHTVKERIQKSRVVRGTFNPSFQDEIIDYHIDMDRLKDSELHGGCGNCVRGSFERRDSSRALLDLGLEALEVRELRTHFVAEP